MTALSSIDPAGFLHDQLASALPDLLRSMLTVFVNTLMSAEAESSSGYAVSREASRAVLARLVGGQGGPRRNGRLRRWSWC
jgi:putative transposase